MPANSDAIKILLIEDHIVFSKAVSAMIGLCADVETEVVPADNLTAGLEMLARTPFDLVLLDLTLPDSSGLETLVAVRQLSTAVPIVILTGMDDETMAVEALSLGAQDYMLKGDINARHLRRTIFYAIERNRLHVLEAERLRLFEQREDFMATLTHDLKNPLIGANRIIELIVNGHAGEISPKGEQLLTTVRDSNAALLSMIRNLLEVYRYEKDIHTLIRENTDLARLVRKYLDDAEPLIQIRGIKVEAQIEECPHPVYADQHAILRVVQNLIDNAIKFSPEGGMVKVKLWENENEAFFEVSDSGPGIAEEDKTRLFQRFWQGQARKTHPTGTGLGLYLCRQIIEAHNGKILYTSKDSQGSVFTVSLPVGEGARQAC